MTTTASRAGNRRARWLAIGGAATCTVLTVVASATPIGAGDESTTTEESSTSSTVDDGDDDTSTSSDASTSLDASTSSEVSTSAPGGATTAPGATAAPTGTSATASSGDFTAALAAECDGDTGHPLLADALEAAVGDDGSNRIVEILRTCDVEFVGAVDQALGRPATNVEALIDDPFNNVTPNQAQLDLLEAELAIYWRIADAWAETQVTAAGDVSTSDASTSEVSTTVAASGVSTSESSTTTG